MDFMLFMYFMVKNQAQPVGWARFLCPPLEDIVGTAQLCAGQIYNCCIKALRLDILAGQGYPKATSALT